MNICLLFFAEWKINYLLLIFCSSTYLFLRWLFFLNFILLSYIARKEAAEPVEPKKRGRPKQENPRYKTKEYRRELYHLHKKEMKCECCGRFTKAWIVLEVINRIVEHVLFYKC